MKTLTPYLTDYKTKAEAVTAYKNGKSFILNDITSRWDGKPCSIRDFPKDESVKIRYNQLRKVTVYNPA